jgi:hypothetical protein
MDPDSPKTCGSGGSGSGTLYSGVIDPGSHSAGNFSYPLLLALVMDLLASKTLHTGPYKS